ncbi:MAG: helix-turn-helix transcriptional regulator [Dehalococcoidales bacterium]|nr:helix-turn-helix transcriptional regulator [Dehalococcoidales bacterium]
MDGSDFRDFKAELLAKPGVRRQYEAQKRKYETIQIIIARRNELSLSQRELARMVGMQQPAICRLERGDNNITLGTLFKVIEALNLDIKIKPKAALKV